MSSPESPPPAGDAPDQRAASRFLAALGVVESGPISPQVAQNQPGPPTIEPSATPLPQSTPTKSAYPSAEPDPPRAASDPFPNPAAQAPQPNPAPAAPQKPVAAPPFWLPPNPNSGVKGTSAAPIPKSEPGPAPLGSSFVAKPLEPARAAPQPVQPKLQVEKVACPACRSDLSISRAHLNVEGGCPECGSPIVAREDPRNPASIRVEFGAGYRPPAPVEPVQPQPVPMVEVVAPPPQPPAAQPQPQAQNPEPAPAPAREKVVIPNLAPQPAAAAEPEDVPVLLGGLGQPESKADFAESPKPAPIAWTEPKPGENSAEPGPAAAEEKGKIDRDPLRLFAGVILVLLTCVLVVLALYAPEFVGEPKPAEGPEVPNPTQAPSPEPKPEPGSEPAAPSDPESPAELVIEEPAPPPAEPIRARPLVASPIPPEGRPEDVFAAPEPEPEPVPNSIDVTESNPDESPDAEPPAIVFVDPNRPPRPETEGGLAGEGRAAVRSFLEADTIAKKLNWVLDADEQEANLKQFYAYEPLTSALATRIEHRMTTEAVEGRPAVSVFDLKMESTLPHRIYVVHPERGRPKIDFALYRQIREGSLHRYLERSPEGGAAISPEDFRVTLKRIAYRDVQDRVDATLFREPPLLFEVGLPFHEGTPVIVPVAIGSPIVEELERVGWNEPVPAHVELQWQPSETDPTTPVRAISKVISWEIW